MGKQERTYMKKKISIEDFPKFSPWPARLLGLEEWKQRYKTPAEISREFEHEKWGLLLKRVSKASNPVTVRDVNKWFFENWPDMFCSLEDRFLVLKPSDANQYYLKLVKGILKQFMPASAIVELGAGYGNIILTLAKEAPFSRVRIMAAEYTRAGSELIKRLAKTEHLEVSTGRCDFSAEPMTNLTMPKNAIIFTSFATPYVPKMPLSFIKQLNLFEPKVVVHFEPFYEHCDSTTLTGLMRKRYIEVNDYNRNLATLLHDQQRKKQITIHLEEPAVFGSNPLLPASVIAWSPRKRSR
jgi:hypothetical protein